MRNNYCDTNPSFEKVLILKYGYFRNSFFLIIFTAVSHELFIFGGAVVVAVAFKHCSCSNTEFS